MIGESAERIRHLTLDAPPSSTSLLHVEKNQAIADLIEFNSFSYIKSPCGPYDVALSSEDGYLVFRIRNADGEELPLLAISPRPYRRLIQDYFMMVESYEKVRMDGDPYKLEAIDMGRRGIHNEGAQLVIDRLRDKIEMDFDTARRFFTLICVLQMGNGRLLVG